MIAAISLSESCGKFLTPVYLKHVDQIHDVYGPGDDLQKFFVGNLKS